MTFKFADTDQFKTAGFSSFSDRAVTLFSDAKAFCNFKLPAGNFAVTVSSPTVRTYRQKHAPSVVFVSTTRVQYN